MECGAWRSNLLLERVIAPALRRCHRLRLFLTNLLFVAREYKSSTGRGYWEPRCRCQIAAGACKRGSTFPNMMTVTKRDKNWNNSKVFKIAIGERRLSVVHKHCVTQETAKYFASLDDQCGSERMHLTASPVHLSQNLAILSGE